MTQLASGQAFAAIRGVDYDPTDLAALIHLEGASGLVERYCNRSFAPFYDDEILIDGSGGQSLVLPSPPVWGVEDVVLRSVTADGVVETDVEVHTYEVDEEKGLLWKRSSYDCWERGIMNYGLTFSHGYKLAGEPGTAPELPPEISLVVMALAQRGLALSTSEGGVVTAEDIGSYSVTYSDSGEDGSVGFTTLERSALNKHRLLRIGR